MAKKRLFYVEALDEHTGKVFAEHLDDQIAPQELREQSAHFHELSAWECSQETLKHFKEIRNTANLRFHVWTRREGEKYVSKVNRTYVPCMCANKVSSVA